MSCATGTTIESVRVHFENFMACCGVMCSDYDISVLSSYTFVFFTWETVLTCKVDFGT